MRASASSSNSPGSARLEAAGSIDAHAIGPPSGARGRDLIDRHRGSQDPERSMEARLRRPARDAEQLGDPGKRQIEIEVQDDDCALPRARAGPARDRAGRDRRPGPVSSSASAKCSGLSSTSTTRRRRLRARSMQAWATRLWSQWSKVAGSRSAGRLRHARIRVSWTASWARSGSRRMRRAVASRRAPDARMSSAKACRSPRRARSTSPCWSTLAPRCRRDPVAALDSLRRWRLPERFRLPIRVASRMIDLLP